MGEGRHYSDILVSIAAGLLGGFLFLAIANAVVLGRGTDQWLPTLVSLAAAVGVFATVAVMVRTMHLQREASRRQLRAYLYAAKVSLTDVNGDRPMLSVVVKNFGQTPAYKVVLTRRESINPAGVADPGSDNPMVLFVGDIAPGQEITFGRELDAQAIFAAWPELQAGRQKLYSQVLLVYADAFRASRQSSYLFATPDGQPPDLNRLAYIKCATT